MCGRTSVRPHILYAQSMHRHPSIPVSGAQAVGTHRGASGNKCALTFPMIGCGNECMRIANRTFQNLSAFFPCFCSLFPIIIFIFVFETTLSHGGINRYNASKNFREAGRSILRQHRNERMTGVNPGRFRTMALTAGRSTQYKGLQDRRKIP